MEWLAKKVNLVENKKKATNFIVLMLREALPDGICRYICENIDKVCKCTKILLYL